jgi:hypothetical protein
LFRIRPVAESAVFPEIGLYRQQQESKEYGSNQVLLARISSSTGGHLNPRPRDVFEAGGRSIYTSWRLWPALLALAIAFTLAELVLRKWRGLVQAFRK